VRAPFLITAALLTGFWVSACSKPGNRIDKNGNRDGTGATRDILLVDAPRSESTVVSDLEARHLPKPVLVRRAEPKKSAVQKTSSTQPTADHDHATAGQAAVVPALSQTTSALADRPMTLASVPMSVTTSHGEGRRSIGDDLAPWPEGGTRGPGIIIRGGRGGIDDDCDLHRPGARRPGGVAVNDRMPSIGGGIMVNNRVQRFGGGRVGMPSFSRGRIR